MEVTPEIREEACKLICSKIARETGMAVEWGVIHFSRLRPGTFTYSAIEAVAELLMERRRLTNVT